MAVDSARRTRCAIGLADLLDDGDLLFVLVSFLDLPSVLTLSECRSSLGPQLALSIKALRAALPPPYTPEALDAALAAGDSEVALPLLQTCMSRVKHNLDVLSHRLLEVRGIPARARPPRPVPCAAPTHHGQLHRRLVLSAWQLGFPMANVCAGSGARYLSGCDDLDERTAQLRERGFEIPLVLRELWRALGGVALASPGDDAALDWWRANLPAAVAAGHAPDPLWIDHAAAVLEHAADEHGGQHEFTIPVSFDEEEGFAFRTGFVLHLAPDALSKKQNAHATAATAPGSYAVWLEPEPAFDPELLRFTPPTDETPGGAEPLWRARCSLLRYLRLALLEAGGFPGCIGLPDGAFEPLRQRLTEGLQPF